MNVGSAKGCGCSDSLACMSGFKYGLIGGGVAVAIAVAVVILTTVVLRKSGRVTLGPTAATALPKSINTVILGDWGREGDDNQVCELLACLLVSKTLTHTTTTTLLCTHPD